MARFHINPVTGEPGQCRAQQACPFGGANEHFDSKEEAMQNYEVVMAGMTVPEPTAKDELRERLIAQAEKDTLREQQAAFAPRGEVESREEAERMTEELLTAAKQIAAEHLERIDGQKADPLFPEETMDAHFRRNMIDTLEGRTGAPLPPETFISVTDPDDPMGMPAAEGRADDFAKSLVPGSYSGTYFNEETGEDEPAYVAVYADGTSRARARDLRDDLAYRRELAAKKREELVNTATMWTSLSHEQEDREAMEDYAAAAYLTEEIIRDTDWSNPDSASNGLDKLADLGEDFERKGELADMEGGREEFANRQAMIAGTIENLMDGAYELAGRQRLRPMD